MFRNVTLLLIPLAATIGCGTSDNSNTGEPNSSVNSDAGTVADVPIPTVDMRRERSTYSFVLIEDDTPQGLALDAVEVCNQVGMDCRELDQVAASSDDSLSYEGATNGPNAGDADCTMASFTRLGGSGSWVILGSSDLQLAIESDEKVNVWTGDSQCPLVEAGDKPFRVSLGDDANDRSSFTELGSCLGTCTFDVE